MSTLSHQHLAKMFVSDKEIEKIMNRNKVIEPKEFINLAAIEPLSATKISDIEDKGRHTQKQQIEKIEIRHAHYKGLLLIVHDPSRIFLAISNKLNTCGEKLLDMCNRYDVLAGINAGGFIDKNGSGSGGKPDGIIISNGDILYQFGNILYNLIGFTEDNKLILGSFNLDEIKRLKVRDGVSFYPFLIINGHPAEIVGDGGWGIQPRTAIGQRKDGSVLLLTIDGRQFSSIGVTIKELQEIMMEYGAYNAANLDGGSSTTMVYEGKIINSPCSKSGPRYLPSAFLVKKELNNDQTQDKKQEQENPSVNYILSLTLFGGGFGTDHIGSSR